MNENSELIEFIYQNSKMGVQTITDLLNVIKNKNNKIKGVLEENLKGYEEFVKKSEKLLKKYKVEKKDNGMMTKMGAYMGIKMEMMKDNSDSRVADMLIKGSTMGTVDIGKRIDDYKKEADKEILSLAKDLLEYEEENIEKYKEYL